MQKFLSLVKEVRDSYFTLNTALSIFDLETVIFDKMSRPSSLQRRVSPPPLKRKRTSIVEKTEAGSAPTLAAIEAGEAVIDDHLDYFVKHLEMTCRPKASHSSRLAINAFGELYQRNQHDHGHHFVVHQHNHPIAGIHYDLRLQFSKTSAVSWAIPYGLPGNPNSMRQGRMAVETRIHNVWVNVLCPSSLVTLTAYEV